MYSRGMSDWSLTEIEDINWDVLGKIDDFIVPHGGGEFLDESSVLSHSHKKPRLEVKSDVKKNKSNNYYATNTVSHEKEDTCYAPMQHESSSNIIFPSPCDHERKANGKIVDNCSRVSSTDPESSMFCKSMQKSKPSDITYFEWPDLSNFEDIDKMFGNWEPTFGQEQIANADDLSWFSSSNIIHGSINACDLDFHSSVPDLVASHDTCHFPNSDLLQKNVPPSRNLGKSASSNFTSWTGANDLSNVKSAYKEKPCGGGEKNNKEFTQLKNGYMIHSGSPAIKLENQQSSKNSRTEQTKYEILLDSDVSASQFSSSENISQQKQFIGSSKYMPNLNPHSELVFGIPIHQVPFTTVPNFEGAGINPFLSYKVSDDMANQLYGPQGMVSEEIQENIEKQYRKPSLPRNASVNKNLLEVGNSTEMEDADNTEKVTSFWHLQDAMHQLDVTTKVCIRDSLYRLARSARLRHSFAPQNFGEGKMDRKGIQEIGVSKRAANFMNAETNTNPIDRSIAHLLFHRPLEPTVKTSDCVTSFKSHMTNGQVHVPTTNRLIR